MSSAGPFNSANLAALAANLPEGSLSSTLVDLLASVTSEEGAAAVLAAAVDERLADQRKALDAETSMA